VEAAENAQLMFYAAAAMRTEGSKWAFDGATEIECIIVQPPAVKRWVTTPKRIAEFEAQLMRAVKEAEHPNAMIRTGDHCRWCTAKPICPQMTGAAERALKTTLNSLNPELIASYLVQADMLDDWIKELRNMAHVMLDNSVPVPGYKLVQKRATRQWTKEEDVVHWLDGKGLEPKDIYSKELLSPAQMEKLLKKRKLALPDDLVVAVSSGTTLAPESDPRPAVLQIGKQLTAALSKIN
jgi:hypothetical protein